MEQAAGLNEQEGESAGGKTENSPAAAGDGAEKSLPVPAIATGGGAMPQMKALEDVMKNAAPSVVPQIKDYYRRAIAKLDDLLERDPSDLWARIYRAHLWAEYSGDLDGAMKVWRSCQERHPANPAPYFFLGEGYLKLGNLRECLTNVSKAIALRSLGN